MLSLVYAYALQLSCLNDEVDWQLIPQCILLYGTGQRFNKNCLCSCKPTVGWNDIELFVRFSKTGTMLPFRFIFLSPIPKNRRILPSAARQSFHFQKITVT